MISTLVYMYQFLNTNYVRLMWSWFFWQNIFGLRSFWFRGRWGRNLKKNINSLKPLPVSINFNALGNIFDSQHEVQDKMRSFFVLKTISYSEIPFVHLGVLCDSTSDTFSLSSVKLLHFSLTIKYYSKSIWVFDGRFRSTRIIKGTLEPQSSNQGFPYTKKTLIINALKKIQNTNINSLK